MEPGETPQTPEVVEQHPTVKATEAAVAEKVTSLLPGEEKVTVYGAWMNAIRKASKTREWATGEKLSKWGEFKASLYSHYRAIAAGAKDVVFGVTAIPVFLLRSAIWVYEHVLSKVPIIGKTAKRAGEELRTYLKLRVVNFRKEEIGKAQMYGIAQETKYGVVGVGKRGAEAVGGVVKRILGRA